MKKRILALMAFAASGVMTMLGCSQKIADSHDDIQLVGGFSQSETLTERDWEVYRKAVENRADLQHLHPVSVSRQVVAGLNYIFCCQPEKGKQTVKVRIFEPLPGRGEPNVVSVEK